MVKKENSQIQFNKCSSGELLVPPAWQTRPISAGNEGGLCK